MEHADQLAATIVVLVLVGCPSTSAVCRGGDSPPHDRDELSKDAVLKHSPIKGGLLVHLGPKTSRLLMEFSKEKRFVCQGLTRDAMTRHRIRKDLDAGKVYGRYSIVALDETRLPYADNLVRILVVENANGIAVTEMWRALCPGGLLFRKTENGWLARIKPRSTRIDEWTHPRHGADGNVVSKDEYVGQPTNARWISAARYDNGIAPHPTRVIVTSGGRLFVVTGGGSRTFLRAQDAFSGIELWRRPYPTVKTPRLNHRSYWIFPALIANGDTLFITGQALDASIGKSRFSIDGNPVVCDNNVVVTSAMKAYDATTGKQLWQHAHPGVGLTIGENHLFFVEKSWPTNGGLATMVALHLGTGKLAWRRVFNVPVPDSKRSHYDNYGAGSIPNGLLAGVIYHKGTLALEVTRTYIYLFSAKDGRHVRSLRYKNWSPYASGLRALMIDNKLWLLEAQKDFDFGYNINAYSLKDGSKVTSIKLKTPIRQRCRPPLASEKYMFLGGLNSVNLSSGLETVRPIARSLCNFGVVPANGLIYVPPTHCHCNATLKGYIALESLKDGAKPVTANMVDHLVKGRGYRKQLATTTSQRDWPQFRQGPLRRAHSESTVPPKLKRLWSSPAIGSAISSPVVSRDLVVVSEPKSHRLSAFDLLTGKKKWSFVAGAAIDGPPTMAGGYVVFGSRDGWVYALSLSDGELLWKNMAAPAERRIMVNEQLESAWPALGPVVIADGKVMAVAGRHNMAEAGILVSGFDLVTGRKIWQSKTPHRAMINPLTSGVYQKLYDKKQGVTETLPAAALLGGWLVGKGQSVQIDRLAAFNIANGTPDDLFDRRVEKANAARRSSYKNGSRKNDFERWLLSAQESVRLFDAGSGPKNTVAIASANKSWVVVTDSNLIVFDDNRHETFRIGLGKHKVVRHGIAVAKSRVFVTTEGGQVLCFGW